jgi:hypothetical protein
VTVREGDHMVEIYSPELYVAQQELLQAVESDRRMGTESLEILREAGHRTIQSARERLRLYGLGPDQIDAILERGEADEHVTLYAQRGGVVVHKNALEGMYVQEGTLIYTIADLSKLWVLLDAYEADLAWLSYGQDVEFEVRAYPGEVFHGRVAFIDPVLDDESRTVKVRLNVENPDGKLKPAMFVSAVARAVLTPHGRVVDDRLAGRYMCPMHPEVLADDDDDAARQAARTLVERLDALDASGLEGPAGSNWSKLGPSLATAAEAAATAGDIEARRLTLVDLTSRLTIALEHFGYHRDGAPLQVFHCPMALDGDGGDWLQFGDETANPYYGDAMLRCGNSQRVLSMEP